MFKSKLPFVVALFAIASLLCGFLFWRGAPDEVKLAGAIGAVLVPFLSAVLNGSEDEGPRGGTMGLLLFAALALYAAEACTPQARSVAEVDFAKVAVCAAEECGESPDAAAFGLCLATRCTVQNLPPADIVLMFESTQRLKARAVAGTCPAAVLGKDGGR